MTKTWASGVIEHPLAVSAATFWSIFAALLALSALPVLLVEIPPLFDYPNHLARMYLLAHLAASPTLRSYYTVHWSVLPNLGMDLLVPVLSRFLPLAWAGKLFLVAVFALLAGGAAALHRAVAGRWTLWPLGVFLFLYSRVLLWGFLNYLFGLGLALTAFAVWIALARHPPWLRAAVGAIFAVAVFFAHLLAAVVLAVLIGGYELDRLRRFPAQPQSAASRLVALAFAFAAPAVLFLAGSHASLGELRFSSWGRKFDLPFSVFDDYHRAFDVVCFVLLVVAAALLFARRRIQVLMPLRLPLLLLFILYLAAPAQIMTASAVDHRLPLALAVLLAAATTSLRLRVGGARILIVAAAALFAIRMGLVAQAWQSAAAVYRDDIAIIDALPPGARVALAYPPDAIDFDAVPRPHLPLLAVIRREAFVPTLFAAPPQQPVLLTPLGQHLADEANPDALWRAFRMPDGDAIAAALRDYDFLIVLDRRPLPPAASPALRLIAREPDLALYQVPH